MFGASSGALDAVHYEAARQMGREIAAMGCELVFGGGDSGVMGACARGCHEGGGRVVGVIPEALNQPGIPYLACDELIETRDLRDRMETMARRSDAFVVMTGGFGTLYELFEVLTLNQLAYVEKPVLLVNTEGYYDSLLAQFEAMYSARCAGENCRLLYDAPATAQEAARLLREYAEGRRARYVRNRQNGRVK